MSRQLVRSLLHHLVSRHAGSRGNDPLQTYRMAWDQLTRSRLARFLADRYQHRFQPDASELLTLILIEHMRDHHPRFEPPVRRVRVPEAFAPGNQHGPAIIVGAHTGYGSAYATLSDLGHRVSLLIDAGIEARNPTAGTARHPGLELIPNGRLSLAHAMQALKKQRLVCCAVDYQDLALKTYSLVSPAMFELARRTATPLYFAKNTVADDGTIEVAIDGPFPVVDAVRSAQDMIDYINAGRCQPKSLKLRALSDDASPESELPLAPITLPAAKRPATTAPPAQSR